MGYYNDQLEFAIDQTITTNGTNGYGTSSKKTMEKKDYDTYMGDLISLVKDGKTSELRHHILSEVSGGVFGSKIGAKHILMLDCDSRLDMENACTDLQRKDIKYCVIISSYYDSPESEHYWILGDYIRPIKDVLEMAASIRGVDQRYIRFCGNRGMFNLRAYPRKNSVPVFMDDWIGRSKEFKDWMDAYQLYWWGNDVKSLVRVMVEKKMYPDHSIESVGSHLDLATYESIQYFINKDYGKEVVIQSKIMGSMNAVYGLEV